METGTFNTTDRTFDIANVNETETSILLTNTQLSLTYRNEANELVKLTKSVPPSTGLHEYKKPITDQRNGAVGDRLSVYKEGYLCTGGKDGPKLLMGLDWDTHGFTTRTFDKDGITYLAAAVPVVM